MKEITVSPVQSKRCRKCDTVRHANQFHVDSRSKDRLRAQCKPCRNRIERARRALNGDVERTRRRELYQIKFAEQEGIPVEAATPGNRIAIKQAKRMRWDARNKLPDDLVEDLKGGISVRDTPDKPLSAFEKHQGGNTLDKEANDWLKANDPLFDDHFYEAV